MPQGDSGQLTWLIVASIFKNDIARRVLFAVVLGIALLSSASILVLIAIAAIFAGLELWARRTGT